MSGLHLARMRSKYNWLKKGFYTFIMYLSRKLEWLEESEPLELHL